MAKSKQSKKGLSKREARQLSKKMDKSRVTRRQFVSGLKKLETA